MIGHTLGRYLIEAELGAGGMGVVYRARDTVLRRAVAIKMLRAGTAAPLPGASLLREARAASALSHPNICAVFEIGDPDGEPFIVMESGGATRIPRDPSQSGRVGSGPDGRRGGTVGQLLGFVKTMVVGGLIFLFPLVFVTFVVGRAFMLMLQVTRPIVNAVTPVHTAADVALINFVTIVALLAGCLVAGLIASSSVGRAVYRAADANLAKLIPGYAVFRARLGNAVEEDARRKEKRTILVHLDDQSMLAIEVERLSDGRVVAFLPGAPDVWSGSSVVVDARRVTPLDLDVLHLSRTLRDLGLGTAAALRDVLEVNAAR
jgi:uncharacterized membrane protein